MDLEEHEKNGWKKLYTFGYNGIILVKNNKKILFDLKSDKPICVIRDKNPEKKPQIN